MMRMTLACCRIDEIAASDGVDAAPVRWTLHSRAELGASDGSGRCSGLTRREAAAVEFRPQATWEATWTESDPLLLPFEGWA